MLTLGNVRCIILNGLLEEALAAVVTQYKWLYYEYDKKIYISKIFVHLLRTTESIDIMYLHCYGWKRNGISTNFKLTQFSVLTIPNPKAINVIGFFMNSPLPDNSIGGKQKTTHLNSISVFFTSTLRKPWVHWSYCKWKAKWYFPYWLVIKSFSKFVARAQASIAAGAPLKYWDSGRDQTGEWS